MKALRAIGATIRRMRHERNLSQMALAHEAGITPSYLGGVERGDRNASLEVVLRIAKALEIPAGALLSPDEFTLHHDIDKLVDDLPVATRGQILHAVCEVVRVLRATLRIPDKRTGSR